MRLFLAVEIPEEQKKKLSQELRGLKEDYAQFRWVEPENFHLTLQFFGEFDDAKSITKRVEKAIFECKSSYMFVLNADILINDKILLYIAFKRDKELEDIVEKVQTEFGIPEFKFLPHMTIAKFKVPSKQQYWVLKKRLSEVDFDVEFPVKEIVLLETVHEGKKPIYQKVASFPLQ